MRYEDENIWLTQKMMATLYDVNVRTINEHIKKIYSDSELEEDATIRNFRIVQTEGSRQITRDTKHYKVDSKCWCARPSMILKTGQAIINGENLLRLYNIKPISKRATDMTKTKQKKQGSTQSIKGKKK